MIRLLEAPAEEGRGWWVETGAGRRVPWRGLQTGPLTLSRGEIGELCHRLLGIAPDERDALGALAEGARGADLLVTSGGVSVGAHDLVRTALGDQGLAVDFWKIAMRPGKPLLFGRIQETPILGLPGNPVSTLVCATLFLRPAMAVMQGLGAAPTQVESAILGADLPTNDRRQDYLRARLETDTEGRRLAMPFPRQDSSMLATLAQADCLVVRAPLAAPAKAGDAVEIVPLSGGVLTI